MSQIFVVDVSKKAVIGEVLGGTDYVPIEELEKVYVSASQGEVGTKFQVKLVDNGNDFTVPEGADFSIWYLGPKTKGSYTQVDGNPAVTVTGNYLKIIMAEQMMYGEGGGSMDVFMHTADGELQKLFSLDYIITAVDSFSDPEAGAYFTAFSETAQIAKQYAQEAKEAAETLETDTTLLVSGKAADAAAVGEALENKLSAGAKYFSVGDMDDIKTPGWYYTDGQLSVGAYTLVGCYMHVDAKDENYACQTIYSVSPTQITPYPRVRRSSILGEWSEWEWEDPELLTGVEYRTTKRYAGLPVYAKKIDFGSLPDTGSKTLAIGISHEKIVSMTGIPVGPELMEPFPIMHEGVPSCYAWMDGSSLIAFSKRDYSSYEAAFVIEYTK